MRMRNPLFLCEDPACEAEFTILDADLALSDNLLSPTTYLPNTKNTIFLFYISLWCFFAFRHHTCVWQAGILKWQGGGSGFIWQWLSPTTYLLNTKNTPQNTQGDICIWNSYLCVFVLFLWTICVLQRSQQRRRCHFCPNSGGLVLVFTDNMCLARSTVRTRERTRCPSCLIRQSAVTHHPPSLAYTPQNTHMLSSTVFSLFFQHCFCEQQGQNSFATFP